MIRFEKTKEPSAPDAAQKGKDKPAEKPNEAGAPMPQKKRARQASGNAGDDQKLL